jgi:hypothetical protein
MDQTAWLRCTVDGITIYVDRALNEHARALTVSAAGFRRWRRLFVESH